MQTALPVRLGLRENLNGLIASRGGRVVLALSANALLAVSAHISLPLFFTPVPLTLQTFAVVLTGLLLGPSLAFSAVMLYLAEGAMGLPVFSPAGPGGPAQLFGITGGFLISYPLAAAAAGFMARAFGSRFSRFGAALIAGTSATLITFVIGGFWIAHLSHTTWQTTVAIGVGPFVPGEIIKIIAAAGAYGPLRRYVHD
jgi:biotin transport system substrate-specific component